mmetsp:Transcript_151146/g.485561  ORF Transcript_151146/g.485561 Transcript_151146/m.485561 type:complete len:368 (+) Transcript_151146:96-1199(+)
MLGSVQEFFGAAVDRLETARAGKALLDGDVDGRTERFIRSKLDYVDVLALDADIVARVRGVISSYEEVAARLRKADRGLGAAPAPAGVEGADFRALAERCEERARRYRIVSLLGEPPADQPMTKAERDTATILQARDRVGLSRSNAASGAANAAGGVAAEVAATPFAGLESAASERRLEEAAWQSEPIAKQASVALPGFTDGLAVPRLGLRRGPGGLKIGLFACLEVQEDIKKAKDFAEVTGMSPIGANVHPRAFFSGGPDAEEPEIEVDTWSYRSSTSQGSTRTPETAYADTFKMAAADCPPPPAGPRDGGEDEGSGTAPGRPLARDAAEFAPRLPSDRGLKTSVCTVVACSPSPVLPHQQRQDCV